MQKSIILLQNNQLRNWYCNQTTISFKSQPRHISAVRSVYCNQTTISFKSQLAASSGKNSCNCNQTTISFKSQLNFPGAGLHRIVIKQRFPSNHNRRPGQVPGPGIVIKQRFPSNHNASAQSLNFLLYFGHIINLPRLNGIIEGHKNAIF